MHSLWGSVDLYMRMPRIHIGNPQKVHKKGGAPIAEENDGKSTTKKIHFCLLMITYYGEKVYKVF